MKKLNQRETVILFITLSLVLIFGVYQFVLKPVQEGSMNIDDRLLLDHIQLVKANQLLAKKVVIDARYMNLVDSIGVVDSEEAQMPGIVAKIEGAAREANVHIANIQPQKSTDQGDVTFLSVELEIDGQWLDIVHFLYLIQQPPNFYFINELNLEKYSGAINSLRGRVVISRMFLVNP